MEDSFLLPDWKYKGYEIKEIMYRYPGYLKFLYYKAGCGSKVKDWIWAHMDEIEKLIIKKTK
jgi:hypothetical protein